MLWIQSFRRLNSVIFKRHSVSPLFCPRLSFHSAMELSKVSRIRITARWAGYIVRGRVHNISSIYEEPWKFKGKRETSGLLKLCCHCSVETFLAFLHFNLVLVHSSLHFYEVLVSPLNFDKSGIVRSSFFRTFVMQIIVVIYAYYFCLSFVEFCSYFPCFENIPWHYAIRNT